VYDGWNLIGTLNSQLSTLDPFVLSTLNLQLSTPFQPATHLVSYDGNGNVTALVNAADGSESARYEYGPFGEVIRASGPACGTNPFRFSTKYQDDETDLLYYGYRYYSASTGRWLSRDPIAEKGGANIYAFCWNSPVGKVDVLGLGVNDPPVPRYPLSSGCKCAPGKKEGRMPKPAPYTPSVNGCSAPIIGGGPFDFTPSCNTHDRCYGTCNSEKGKCDKQLHDDMIAQCNAQFPPPDPGGGSFPGGGGFPPVVITVPDPTLEARKACYKTAEIYYGAVVGFGDPYFEKGQKAACVSCCCRL
jgi:RHS repeat-associated protein